MQKNLSLFLCFILFSLIAKAQTDEIQIGDVCFNPSIGTYSNVSLAYRLAEINTSETVKSSLAIYLHGGTSKGDDNAKQLEEKGIDSIATYIYNNGINAVMLVPQCPADKSWGGKMNVVVKALIDDIVKSHNIDTERIYIFGGSMGGTATWSLLSAYPQLFTAAMPVAGNPSSATAENVAQTPVYSVMGTADKIMSVDNVSTFIAELQQLGCDAQLDIVDGWTHETTCIESYTAERLAWVFAHTVKNKTEASVKTVKTQTAKTYYRLDGTAIKKPSAKGLYIEKSDGQSRKIVFSD